MDMKQILIFTALCCMGNAAVFAQSTIGSAEPNVVIVKFERTFVENELKPNFSKKVPKAVPAIKSKRISALNKKHAVKAYTPVFRTDPRYVERHKEFGLDLYYRVEYSGDESIEAVCQSFAAGGEVLSAEPSCPDVATETPNDPYYDTEQWGLKNKENPGMDINVDSAWVITTGHPDVIVAVIDNCVEYTHRDILPNMWYNFGEIPFNGIDDDNNGYIDDYRGWNFRDENDDVGLEAISDEDDHGTHVAGILAARSNEGMGMAGVAGGWGSEKGIRMMHFRVAMTGKSDYRYGYQAMVYAADNGAAIAQCSWGGIGTFTPIKKEAMEYFQKFGGGDIMNGGLVIAAAGNENTNDKFYPAYAANVLSVGAMTKNGERWSSSNYGEWVKICAPGSNIYSTIHYNGYGMKSGTSMACPMVSGVAALVLSATLDLPRDMKTPEWLTNILINTANKNWMVNSQIGPLVDAGAAVRYAHAQATSNRPSQQHVESVTQVFPNPVLDNVTIRNTSSASTKSYTLFNAKGEMLYLKKSPQEEETIDMGALPVGLYFLRVETENGGYAEKIVKR